MDSLFGGCGHTTVNNITNINNGNTTHQGRKENKKESEDSRKLLALGIVAAVVCVAFHAALVACAVYPVLPVWGLAILGVNSLVCFAGGLAFHMKHEEESENIEKAKGAVDSCLRQGHGYGDSSRYDAPPPYFSQDPNTTPTAPPQNAFDNPYLQQKFGNWQAMTVMATKVLLVDFKALALQEILATYSMTSLVEDSVVVQVDREQKEVQQEYLEQAYVVSLKLP
uniref:Uncharacterized protein n=1 Tax=Glossina morsitans morsitans TaxID=37546 RepID=A0A1B0FE76_GLOMM